jgi:hypothetical protein
MISDAGKFKPGLILGQDQRHGGDGRSAPVVLVGKAYCRVDAQHDPIEMGDMLSTSATTDIHQIGFLRSSDARVLA